MTPAQSIHLRLFLTLLSFAALHSSDCSEQCGISGTILASTQWRIVGGGEAKAHQNPWMAYLENQFVSVGHEDVYTYCGGSVLDSQWILSAAHCFVPPADNYNLNRVSVVLGAHNLANHSEPRTVIFAKKIYRHTSYDLHHTTSKYDIAMVQLSHSIDLSTTSHVAPICLPTEGEMVSKTNCQLLGFGRIGTNEKKSDVLKAVSLDLMSAQECSKYRSEVSDLEVCAGASGKGPCGSDGGGPLQCQTETGRWVIQGITSYGDKLCGSTAPAVFTNVEKFVSWIENVRKP